MDEPGIEGETRLNPAAWVDRHGDRLFRYALSRLRDAGAAEEVVQETFVSALSAADQYTGQGAEAAWLMGILKRKVIDSVRRRNRPDASRGSDDADDLSHKLFDGSGNWRSDPRFFGTQPGAALERREFWEVLRGCLSALPPRQADVFVLREMEGLASEAICKELEITTSNLWVLLYRARLRLSDCIKSRWEH